MIAGTFAAMMTPWTASGELNLPAVRELTEFIIDKGACGLFPVSNVGGMIHMRPEEKRLMVQTVVDQARGRVPVFPGVSASSTRDAIALGQMCAELKADGCVLSAPYYFPYPQSVVLDGLKAAVSGIPLPVAIYNIPKYAGEITPDSFETLMQLPNVCAVKDSSGSIANLLQLSAMRDRLRPDFSLLVGWEEMLLSALTLGAQGCMTASAGIFPEIMRDLYESVRRGDMAHALACQRLIGKATPVFQQVFFPLGYQWAMEARGIPMGLYAVTCDEAALAPQREAITQAVRSTLDDYAALCREGDA